MPASRHSLATIHELRRYVAETLGKIESLELEQFPVTEELLIRSGRPCAIYFCLHGPRQVRLSTVWETEANRILFYGSCGRRVQLTQLDVSPSLVA